MPTDHSRQSPEQSPWPAAETAGATATVVPTPMVEATKLIGSVEENRFGEVTPIPHLLRHPLLAAG